MTDQIDDTRVSQVNELTAPCDVIQEVPMTSAAAALVCETRNDIHRILNGADSRLLVIVGPCSVHDPASATEYARWLLPVRRRFSETLLIVMRVYVEKPRTRVGWKGLVSDPFLDGTFRIEQGLRTARKLLSDINTIGVPAATEYVDVVTPQYFADLVSWAAIGARTVEGQLHRQLASGVSCPVGFKNSTDGNIELAVNAVVCARGPHHFIAVTKRGKIAVIATSGNEDCHIILRGGRKPNFDKQSITDACGLLERYGLDQRVMVDCSHGNCEGDYHRQVAVAQEVRRQLDSGSTNILGVMVESNLVEGSQEVYRGQPVEFGQSVTDPCIGLEETVTLLEAVSDGCGRLERRAHSENDLLAEDPSKYRSAVNNAY